MIFLIDMNILEVRYMRCTKYEKARIIGSRALQIGMGAPFMLELSQKDLENLRYSAIEIAKLEFEKEVIPITVKRPFPDHLIATKIEDDIKKKFENISEISIHVEPK